MNTTTKDTPKSSASPNDTALGTRIDTRFWFARLQQEPIFDDFTRYRALWQSKITDTKDYPWDYTLFNPMVFATVRTMVGRIAAGNTGVTLQAWNEEGRPKTEVNQALITSEFQESQLGLRVARSVFSAALYGKGFLSTGWLFQKQRVIEEEDDKGKVIRKVMMSPVINRADLSNVRVYDVFVANQNLPDLVMQPWIIIRRFRTIKEMKQINEARGQTIYKNLDKIKDRGLFSRFVDYGKDVMNSDGNSDIPLDSGVLETLEMWDMAEGTVSEMIRGHREHVLREEDNPYYHGGYPLVELPFFPEDDQFWNTGVVRPMEDLQMGLNSVLNQYLTNARQQLNNMWVTGDLRIADWEFISRPNGVIHASGDIQQIREVQHKDITTTSMAMMQELKATIERTTGMNDLATVGLPTPGGGKGVGVLTLEEHNIDQNLKLFLTLLEQVTITQVAKQFLSLNAQYITDEQIVRMVGRHGYKHLSLKPDDVSAEFDPIVIANSSLPTDNMVKAQNLMNIKALADKEQKVQLNTAPIWKEIITTMGLTDLDEIVPDDKAEALEENDLLDKGVEVPVQVNDNHDIHIPIHQFDLVRDILKPEQVKRRIQHIEDHKRWKLAQDPDLIEKLQGQAPTVPPQTSPQALGSPLDATASAGAPQALGQPLGAMPGAPLPPADLPPAATSLNGIANQFSTQMLAATQPQAGSMPINPLGGGHGA